MNDQQAYQRVDIGVDETEDKDGFITSMVLYLDPPVEVSDQMRRASIDTKTDPDGWTVFKFHKGISAYDANNTHRQFAFRQVVTEFVNRFVELGITREFCAEHRARAALWMSLVANVSSADLRLTRDILEKLAGMSAWVYVDSFRNDSHDEDEDEGEHVSGLIIRMSLQLRNQGSIPEELRRISAKEEIFSGGDAKWEFLDPISFYENDDELRQQSFHSAVARHLDRFAELGITRQFITDHDGTAALEVTLIPDFGQGGVVITDDLVARLASLDAQIDFDSHPSW